MSEQNSKGTAVITGASSGIGAVYAHRLAQRGYDLLLIARGQEELNQVASSATSGTGRSARTLVADLTVKEQLRAVETTLRSDKSIRLLVNNAGLGSGAGLLQTNIDDLENMIDLNVTALTRLTAAVLPNLVEAGQGAVVNISSIVAVNPEALNGAYSGSKSYVVSFTQALHSELKGKGVQVQVVLPGITETKFWGRFGVPMNYFKPEQIMSAEGCVDAALAGLDQGELVTLPALPDANVYKRFDDARLALYPFLTSNKVAARYGTQA